MKFIAFYLLLILNTQAVFGETYRINSETQLKEILVKVRPGDKIIIANGSYNNWNVNIASSGTPQKPIIITAETAGKVIFTGSTIQTIFKFSGAYIQLSGITFSGCELSKADGKTAMLVELNNTNNCLISNCTFEKNVVKTQFTPLLVVSGNGKHNKVENCTFIGNVDSQDIQVKITKDSCPQLTTITKNTFRDKQKVSWKNGNGGECVQIGQDPVLLGIISAKTTVSQNRFIQCNGENEVISNKSSGNQYVKNYFENNDGELVMRGGHDCTIDGNIFEGGTGGIRINGSGHTITNNKINNIKTAIRLMYGMAKGKEEIGFYIAASGCTITNNTITNAITGILVGDSKDTDWTGKFDTKRYPSPVIQNIAPFDNVISGNKILKTETLIKKID